MENQLKNDQVIAPQSTDGQPQEVPTEVESAEPAIDQTTEQPVLSPEEQLTGLDNKIATQGQEITKLNGSIESTVTKLNEVRGELAIPLSEELPPSVASEKVALEKLQKEQNNLEAQREEIINKKSPEIVAQQEKYKGWWNAKGTADFKENRESDGKIKTYRGIRPQAGKTKKDYTEAVINPLDWVTTDRKLAEIFAGEDGVVLERTIPTAEMYRSFNNRKPKFIWAPEGYSPLDSTGSTGGIGEDGPTEYSNRLFKDK